LSSIRSKGTRPGMPRIELRLCRAASCPSIPHQEAAAAAQAVHPTARRIRLPLHPPAQYLLLASFETRSHRGKSKPS
jgi:hypothetical protein